MPLRTIVPWAAVFVLGGWVAARQMVPGPAGPLELVHLYRLAHAFDRAAERGDPEAIASLFHADAEHRGLTTGRLIRGHEQLARVFRDEMSGDSGADSVDTELVSLRFLTPSVAIVDMTLHYENYRLGDRVWPVFREHTYAIVSKREGEWRLAATSAGGHDDSPPAP